MLTLGRVSEVCSDLVVAYGQALSDERFVLMLHEEAKVSFFDRLHLLFLSSVDIGSINLYEVIHKLK